MDYRKLVEAIPVAKREPLLNKLVTCVLLSKNDEKMPSQLANDILYHWKNDILVSESGLAALLEGAVLLEPEKTIEALTQLELTDFVEQIRASAAKT